jgi:hypothetical protein
MVISFLRLFHRAAFAFELDGVVFFSMRRVSDGLATAKRRNSLIVSVVIWTMLVKLPRLANLSDSTHAAVSVIIVGW